MYSVLRNSEDFVNRISGVVGGWGYYSFIQLILFIHFIIPCFLYSFSSHFIYQPTFVYINPINLRLPLTGTDPNINILWYRSGTVPFRYLHIIISEYRSGTVPFRHEIIILHYLTRLPGDFVQGDWFNRVVWVHHTASPSLLHGAPRPLDSRGSLPT